MLCGHTRWPGTTFSSFFAVIRCCNAWWPFAGSNQAGSQPLGIEVVEPHMIFGNVPVVVVDSHFGSDPFEDMHRNMERLVRESLGPPQLSDEGLGGSGVAIAPAAVPLGLQLDRLLDVFGEHHAGHFGRAEGSFQVDDDHTSRIRITANLPGYKLDNSDTDQDDAESPLTVRAVGKRSLVVSGMQQSGPIMRSWQRTFALPKGSDIDQVEVKYSPTSGNLTVDVPRRNVTEMEATAEDQDDSEENNDMDNFLPPVLQAMRAGLPGLTREMSGGFRARRPKHAGFLLPSDDMPDMSDMLNQALGLVGQMHPRFHMPPGGDQEIPEDAEVNLVGCFAESQLAKVELKYYGDTNAASFNAMYWHAKSDHVPYFAMSRHEVPLGHGFTAGSFAHQDEKPQWGIYDGCGSPCQDDDARWCGCANEASRGLPNPECPSEGEKRFAVYKIGNAAPVGINETASLQGENESKPLHMAAQGRPYWQLTEDANHSKSPTIEIVVPKGTIAKAHGREVLLFNASDAGGSEKADGRVVEAMADGASTTAAPPNPASNSSSATTVGKVRLPVAVSPENCEYDTAREAEDGGQVLKCKLDKKVVKRVPIRVVDEL